MQDGVLRYVGRVMCPGQMKKSRCVCRDWYREVYGGGYMHESKVQSERGERHGGSVCGLCDGGDVQSGLIQSPKAARVGLLARCAHAPLCMQPSPLASNQRTHNVGIAKRRGRRQQRVKAVRAVGRVRVQQLAAALGHKGCLQVCGARA